MAVDRQVLIDLISDTEATRMGVESELDAAEQQVRMLQQRLVELREEEKSFRSALARRFPEAVVFGPIEELDEAASWQMLPRTVAVENAIAALNATQPTVHPADIERYLKNRGRIDDRDAIGGAAAHLNRTGRIHSLGRGKWVHGPAPQMTPGDTASTVPPGSVAATGADGGDDHAALAPPALPQDHDSGSERDPRDLDRQSPDVTA